MDEVLTEFLVESGEMLDAMERELVAFEAGRAGPDAVRTVFRAIHTIKGTCGFLGMPRLQALTHSGENLLSELRDGRLQVTADNTSALLALVDAVRKSLTVIEATGAEGEADFSELAKRLSALVKAGPPPAALAPPAQPALPPVPVATAPGPAPQPIAAPSPVVAALQPMPAPNPVAAAPQSTPAPQPVAAAPQPTPAPKPAAAAPATHEAAEAASTSEAGGAETVAANSTIRVAVDLLDRLMNLVGELVLTRNQVLAYASGIDDTAFAATSQRLNLLTTELQGGVMKARMQPIGNILSKFPRVVRDLAHETGKQARVEMEGVETELDKSILEAIKDPLTHLLRNAIDHGLELPADRVARGKPAEGKVVLRAYQQGGQVNIDIVDDGRGVDLDRVRKKAVERGLVAPEQAARCSASEVTGFLFLPGFSTAEKITSVSGRGVGMDVVKTNVEKIGGTVELHSTPGLGTKVKIKIPLTLAIIPALIVRCSGERYAIPQGSLLEVVRLEGEKLKRGIERVHDTPVYRLRGRLLPLVYLERVLQTHRPQATGADPEALSIVVLQSERHQFGLVVDDINDTQEIVVKPLDQGLKSISIFAGSTIMGDGRVALILDIAGLAQRSRITSSSGARPVQEENVAVAAAGGKDRQALLLLDGQDNARMAIPLAQVTRLEEFPTSAIEFAGQLQVVQYRGQIMPLVRIDSALPERRTERRSAGGEGRSDTLQVVVHRVRGHNVGLVVNRILDVVEDGLEVRRPASRPGVLYSVVVGNKVTEMLDVESLVLTADPSLLDSAPSGKG